MTLENIVKFTDLPKEIILHILEYAVDKVDFVSVLFHINKEIRELVKENSIWIHISHILDLQKSITPIQTIIKSNFSSPDGQIFSKLQEYFQSLPYIQFIQFKKQDNSQDTTIFDPFSKLSLCDSRSFSELIQVFGINVFRAFHSSNESPINCGIMDTMIFDSDSSRGESIIQASFVVGDEEKYINTFLIQFNDKKNEVKEYPILTCPELNVTITASDVSTENFQVGLIEKMKSIISSKYGSQSDFICFEKVRVKRVKFSRLVERKKQNTPKLSKLRN